MLTRVRFEAEGPTPAACQADLYAAAERLLREPLARVYDNAEEQLQQNADEYLSEGAATVITAWRRYISSWVREEVYSALSWNDRVEEDGRIYKGRLVIGLAVGPKDQTITAESFQVPAPLD